MSGICYLLCLSIIVLTNSATTLYRENVSGDLITMNGEGNILAIIDTQSSNALTVLKKINSKY